MSYGRNQESLVCPTCRSIVDDPASVYCPVCGNPMRAGEQNLRSRDYPAREDYPEPEEEEAASCRRGFGSAFVSTVFSILFIVFIVALVLIVYLSALGKNETAPALLSVGGIELSDYLTTWYPTAFAGALAVIALLVIFLANLGKLRYFFRCVGIADIIAAALFLAMGLGSGYLFGRLPQELQAFTANSTETFRSIAFVCAVVLVVLGAICLFIYAMIKILRGDRHE